MTSIHLSPEALRAVAGEFEAHRDEIETHARRIVPPDAAVPHADLVQRAAVALVDRTRHAGRQCEDFALAVTDVVHDLTSVDAGVADAARRGTTR